MSSRWLPCPYTAFTAAAAQVTDKMGAMFRSGAAKASEMNEKHHVTTRVSAGIGRCARPGTRTSAVYDIASYAVVRPTMNRPGSPASADPNL